MTQPQASPKALVFICITLFLDTAGAGIIIPVLPELLMELTGEGLSKAALYGGWLMSLYALLQFFCASI